MAGGYKSARAAALNMAAIRPPSVRAALDVIGALRTYNLCEDLLRYVAKLGDPEGMSIPLLLGIARNFSALNMQGRALTLLDEARRGDPDYPPVLLARAQVLVYMGRVAEARADILRCLARAPEIAHGWWLLSHLERQTSASNHVGHIQGQLEVIGRNRGDVALLQNALHKELDDIGAYDQAWCALEEFCSAKRSTITYDSSESSALVDSLISMPVHSSSRSVDDGPTPIFIVGMHRSGTTLLEQLLDASPQVRCIGELYDFTNAMRLAADHHCRGVVDGVLVDRARSLSMDEVGRHYLDGILWRLQGERFFTDKLPSNFLNIGFICAALPKAKIIHMVRDPLETCFSNLRELFSEANPYSYDQNELAHYFSQYRRLMEHWHSIWPERILDVSYADLIRDPEMVMRGVSDFCGLDYIPSMCDPRNSMRAVATASAVQVRGQIVSRDAPKWMPYADNLKSLILALRQNQ